MTSVTLRRDVALQRSLAPDPLLPLYAFSRSSASARVRLWAYHPRTVALRQRRRTDDH